MDKLLSTITQMVLYFGLTHPCPYCRYHFMARVSRNDQHWQQLGDINEVTRDGSSTSESAVYPLEYLFLGGLNGPDLEDKLSSITDGKSLMLFFWKMHNAVSSSVSLSMTCKTQELADEASYACTPAPDSSLVWTGSDRPEERMTSRLLGRTWPTSNRFMFWLNSTDTYTEVRNQMEDAHVELNQLDRELGTSLREDYWTEGADKEQNMDAAQAVMDAIAKLDESILESNVLYTEYANAANLPSCDAFEESMDAFEPLDVPLPLFDGNFPFLPDACMANHDPANDVEDHTCDDK